MESIQLEALTTNTEARADTVLVKDITCGHCQTTQDAPVFDAEKNFLSDGEKDTQLRLENVKC